jgi:S1-C subfamily serine protease
MCATNKRGTNMLVLPIGTRESENRVTLLGSGFIVTQKEDITAIVTTLHVIRSADKVVGIIPPHQGDLSRIQEYPVESFPGFDLEVVASNPFADIALLVTKTLKVTLPRMQFITSPFDVSIGESVFVIGYPYCLMGSMLETVVPSHVIALGKRRLPYETSIYELVLDYQAHPGSSGAAVIQRSDGKICGIVRGTLSPPEVISVGGIPIGTDTTITYAISAYYIQELITEVFGHD